MKQKHFHIAIPCHAEYISNNIIYPINLQHTRYTHVFSIRVEDIVDPDQMAS